MNDQLDKFFFARLEDLRRRCERDGCGVFSVFLDERQCAEAEKWCRYNIGELSYSFHGGFEDANRKILAVYPVYCQEYIGEEIPIRCLTFTYRREDKLSHRDFLGSFMALRLKRRLSAILPSQREKLRRQSPKPPQGISRLRCQK